MKHPKRKRSRGAALVVVLLFLLVLGGLAATLATLGGSIHREHARSSEEARSFYAAEAGLNEVYAQLETNGEDAALALAFPRSLGHLRYTVETIRGQDDPGLRRDRIRLRAVGTAGVETVGAQLMVHKVPTGFFRWAAFGHAGVTLDSNVTIDSFDSGDGPYPGGELAGDYGNVGSNDDIAIASNTAVYGDVVVGPTGTLDDSAPGITITGDVEASLAPEPMPAVVVPPIPPSGPLSVLGEHVLPSGDHHLTSLEIDGGGVFTITGPARVVLGDTVLRSNGEWVVDASAGPVEIFATGDFVLSSNSRLRSIASRSRDVSIQISSSTSGPDPAQIALDANSDYVGTIYAPHAELELSSNFTVFGALRAESVHMNSNSALHYDEDLLYDEDVPAIYERVSWRRLSVDELRGLGL